MSAVSPGTATVTAIINGPAEAVIPVLVQTPQLGTVTIGADGGVVEGSDGSIVCRAARRCNQYAGPSITPVSQASVTQILLGRNHLRRGVQPEW